MREPQVELQSVQIAGLGERLSALRLCEAPALRAMQSSLEQHGQLTALTLFRPLGGLEIIDGFKRVRAARALGWATLTARIEELDLVEAKLRLRALHAGRGLAELEEGWLVRSLFREDLLSLPEISRRLYRHRSWVWRRLMLVEALDPIVQTDVRLGLLTPRAAVAVSRLPRGNQQAASAVVVRRGLTVRQTELLVEAVFDCTEPAARAELLEQRLNGAAPEAVPGRRPTRALRNEADAMGADVLRIRDVAARLIARLSAAPLEVFTPAATQLLREALVRLPPVLQALEQIITVRASEERP